ncbi:MAG: 4'-phosphopantetheinyl transferase superfamily protein [Alphaproteobacteria bacterium]|nr:4'-phosphopantetheinyl transferase superfamily protein [Alphaproteobacteria bacterium]
MVASELANFLCNNEDYDVIDKIPFSFNKNEEISKSDSDVIGSCVIKFRKFEDELFHKWLSDKELSFCNRFKSEKRRKHYAMGRIAAKIALMQIKGDINPTTINIINATKGYPLFENELDYAVTISHSKNYAGALVFSKKRKIGMDLEYIDSTKICALKRTILPQEKIEENIIPLTVVWCMKESLSKALLCGLYDSLDTFCIKDFICDNNFTYQAKYKYYPQYMGIAKIIDPQENMVLAITADSYITICL